MFGKKPPDRLSERVKSIANGDSKAKTPSAKSREPRQTVFRNATLILADGAKVAVVLTNVSATGVRVEFFTKPALFGELIVSEPTLKLRRRARVAWEADNAAGLTFID